MNSEDKEEIIKKLLEAMDKTHIIKDDISLLEKDISEIVSDLSVFDIVDPRELFDLLQSIEGLNSQFYNVNQKVLYTISKIDIDKKNKKEIRNEIDIDDNFIDQKKEDLNKDKENKLVNNVLDYINDIINKKGND